MSQVGLKPSAAEAVLSCNVLLAEVAVDVCCRHWDW